MEKEMLKELVKDLKSIRNTVYEIVTASNPYDRTQRTSAACEIVHDVTEKYKDLLIEITREKK